MAITRTRDVEKDLSNADPVTGAVGAHPVGTGLGAAAGGMAAGAAIGTVAGPIGTVVGGAVGAVAGAFAGKAVAERINPTLEDDYWQKNFKSRPYVEDADSYEDYGPAYRYGVDSFTNRASAGFDAAEADLAADWQRDSRGSRLEWQRARHAVRDSWSRLDNDVGSSPGVLGEGHSNPSAAIDRSAR